jgi:hypothetical protein
VSQLCGDFALELNPNLALPPEVLAEIDAIGVRLDADLAEARAAGVKLPPPFEGTPAEIADQCFAALRGDIEWTHGKWVKRGEKRKGKTVESHEVETETELVAEKGEPLVMRLRCLQLCTVGLGMFSKIYRPGDQWSESEELERLCKMMQEPSQYGAKKIMTRFKTAPQRGPDWTVEVVGG